PIVSSPASLTPYVYPLSLHDALPISYTSAISNEEDFKLFLDDIKSQHPTARHFCYAFRLAVNGEVFRYNDDGEPKNSAGFPIYRSEEHTSELQSRENLVCRLLLEKKK